MPKVYIAAAFRRFSKRPNNAREYGEILDPAYVQLLEKIEDVFLAFGFSTCLPHRDEGMWGKIYYDPGAISALCFRHVNTSDFIFALAEEGRGVHLELGYAVGLGNKQLILMHRKDSEPSTLLRGFSEDSSPWTGIHKGLCKAITYPYNNTDDLLAKLTEILRSKYAPSSLQTNNADRTLFGLVDVGSHTIKLKVFRSRVGAYSIPIHTDKKSLGIMGDVLQNGELSTESIDKIVNLLKTWKMDCNRLGCNNFIVTGTAALRKARNASNLASAIEKELSWSLKIIMPEDELDYVFQGVKSTFEPGLPLAVLNLGGGSVQVGLGDKYKPSSRFLIDFGTRRITDKWPWHSPMTDEVYLQMLTEVRTNILNFIKPCKTIAVRKLVHTGGELDFMLHCRLPLKLSKFSSIHVSEILVKDFARFSMEFSRLSPDYVAKEFGLDPSWVSGSVASNVIALAIAEALGVKAIVPSNLNVSDGLLSEAMQSPPMFT
ncbi:MAG: hypothetical protein WCS89_02440 [Candidatus Paceibacterota bacterium]|jgi:exopolyphosphatase/guanosine-5'-triphosphate,3'-diphosphate pyrophosphatase